LNKEPGTRAARLAMIETSNCQLLSCKMQCQTTYATYKSP
jgi:hypothetical protein